MNIITKLLTVSIASVAGTLTGLFFSKRLKTRAAYFDALVSLIGYLLTEVKFRRNPIKTILSDFMWQGETPLSKNLSEYLEASEPKAVKLSKGCLKTGELFEVQKFLTAFGSLDSETQEGELHALRERFSVLAKSTSDKRDKYSAMYIKLGFFAGLAAGILFL